MKKLILGISTLLTGLFLFAGSVNAAELSVGNDTGIRSNVDSYSNFTIIDTNHPAAFSGDLTTFSYYAANSNQFRFVVVDGSMVVKWVSDAITPAASGINTYTPSSVHVENGWNVGLYFASTGSVPFNYGGSASYWEANNSGLPTVGETLNTETGFGSSATDRTYSFVATGIASYEQIYKDECKNDGWKTFSNPAFKNQGACVSYVTNSIPKTAGEITMANPSQRMIFNAINYPDPTKGKGVVEYWNYDYSGPLHYKTNIMCANIKPSTKEGWFMFQIPENLPGLTGLYVVSYVKDVGTPGTNGDLYGHAASWNATTAQTWCENGTAPVGMYSITGGNLVVYN